MHFIFLYLLKHSEDKTHNRGKLSLTHIPFPAMLACTCVTVDSVPLQSKHSDAKLSQPLLSIMEGEQLRNNDLLVIQPFACLLLYLRKKQFERIERILIFFLTVANK